MAAMEEGSLVQEPGSGMVGCVDGQVVAMGTWEWVQRHVTGRAPFTGEDTTGNSEGFRNEHSGGYSDGNATGHLGGAMEAEKRTRDQLLPASEQVRC